MFFRNTVSNRKESGWITEKFNKNNNSNNINNINKNNFMHRKEKISLSGTSRAAGKTPKEPQPDHFGKTLFFASLQGSLTVEAAVIMPVFLLCMAAVLQLGNVYSFAVRSSGALNQTAQEMAIAAYADERGSDPPLAQAAASLVYAQVRTGSLAGGSGAVKNRNLLLSSIMKEGDMIRLVMTYQINSPFGMIRMPGAVFVQAASARAWTGRKGSSGKNTSGGDEDGEHVFVTETGSVYHLDENCSHIKLSIRQTGLESAKNQRNVYGEKYHACEHCGKYAGESVYITTDGNRYHSTLGCSGLKRTVREVTKEEAAGLRPCSKCGKEDA